MHCIEWGVPDDYLFNKAMLELHNKKEPFFSCILTQSTHRPFDLNGSFKFGDKTAEDKYKSTVFYTDSCIGNSSKIVRRKLGLSIACL